MATPPKMVDPLPGLAPWAGGKRALAARLLERIDRIPHHCYAEPFVGMGGVFFRRRRAAPCEVLNDINEDVVNLFRVAKRHPSALLAELRLQLFSRAEFERLYSTDPAGLTDIERAARFFFLQRACFGGIPGARIFQPTPYRNRALSPAALRRQLVATARRLARVTIERLPYQEFISRYDRPTTLFYLDPPYWGHETLYGKGVFERADFERLSERLRGLRGRFILSLNDVAQVRRLFAWASIDVVPVTYKLRGTKRTRELIITAPRRRPRATQF